MSEFLTLTDEDDGKLFRVRVLNTGEERIARYGTVNLGRGLAEKVGTGRWPA